jgi:hypothetical protein
MEFPQKGSIYTNLKGMLDESNILDNRIKITNQKNIYIYIRVFEYIKIKN